MKMQSEHNRQQLYPDKPSDRLQSPELYEGAGERLEADTESAHISGEMDEKIAAESQQVNPVN